MNLGKSSVVNTSLMLPHLPVLRHYATLAPINPYPMFPSLTAAVRLTVLR